MSDAHVLDSRDPRAARWLAVQRGFALRPMDAAEALRADPDPAARLALLRPRPPRDAVALPEALRRLSRVGARLVPLVSPAYPSRLSGIADPAPVLSVIGDLAALHAPAIAIIGSRAATAYGRAVARAFAGELAAAGLVVVSGLAHGIDAEAHRAALDAGGRTIAVQACGPDHVYPAAHRALARRIAENGGALVGELPPGTRPRRAYFPLRNRLISGLSRGLLVVEARRPSGSLTTVSHALDQGCEVFAVPGPITAPSSAGTNQMIWDGATPALCVRDVLEGVGLSPGPASSVPAPAAGAAVQPLLALLAREPASHDELLRALPDASGLSRLLIELELEGRITRGPDGRFRPRA